MLSTRQAGPQPWRGWQDGDGWTPPDAGPVRDIPVCLPQVTRQSRGRLMTGRQTHSLPMTTGQCRSPTVPARSATPTAGTGAAASWW